MSFYQLLSNRRISLSTITKKKKRWDTYWCALQHSSSRGSIFFRLSLTLLSLNHLNFNCTVLALPTLFWLILSFGFHLYYRILFSFFIVFFKFSVPFHCRQVTWLHEPEWVAHSQQSQTEIYIFSAVRSSLCFSSRSEWQLLLSSPLGVWERCFGFELAAPFRLAMWTSILKIWVCCAFVFKRNNQTWAYEFRQL